MRPSPPRAKRFFQANSCPLYLCQFLLILKDPVQIYHSEIKLQKLCHCHGPNCIHRGGSKTTFLFQKIIYVIQIPDKRQELIFLEEIKSSAYFLSVLNKHQLSSLI